MTDTTLGLTLNRRGLAMGAFLASALPALRMASTAVHAQATPPPSGEQLREIQAWARSFAVQAATYAAPIVAMYLLRDTVCTGSKPKARVNEIWRLMDIANPQLAAEAGYVTPNVDVIYGFGFFDLGPEPVILSAPDSHGRYYMIEICDMWTNAFAYPAGKIAGYEGGRFALVGPGWKGMLPADVKRIDCPTRWVELQPRVRVKNEADLPGARAVLQAITVKGLAEFSGRPAPASPAYNYESPKINSKVASSQMLFDDPLQFWSVFSAAMNENPPPKNEMETILTQFRYFGIELGKPWVRDRVEPLMLAEMKAAAAGIGEMMNQTLAGKLVSGWAMPPYAAGNAGADYMLRGRVAVLGLTANTTVEAIYLLGAVDNESKPLTGAEHYTVTFKPSLPYAKFLPPGFWSLTMYDGATKLTVPNPINRYSLAFDSGMKPNADGSFTMYLQHDNPGRDEEANWLPAPAGPFYTLFRNYAPAPEFVDSLKDLSTVVGPAPITRVT